MNKKIIFSISKILVCAMFLTFSLMTASNAATNGFNELVRSPSITIAKPATDKLAPIKVSIKAVDSSTLVDNKFYIDNTEIIPTVASQNGNKEVVYQIPKKLLPKKNKTKTIKVYSKASNMESIKKVITVKNEKGKKYTINNAPKVKSISFANNNIVIGIASTGDKISSVEVTDTNNNKVAYTNNKVNNQTPEIKINRNKINLKSDTYYRIKISIKDSNGAYTIKDVAFKLPELTTSKVSNTNKKTAATTASNKTTTTTNSNTKTTALKSELSIYEITDSNVEIKVNSNNKMKTIVVYDKNNKNKKLATINNINKKTDNVSIKSSKLKVTSGRYGNLIFNITDENGTKTTSTINVNLKDKTKHKNRLDEVRKNWNLKKMDSQRVKLVEKAVSKVGVIDYIGAAEAASKNYKIANTANPDKLSCSGFIGWAYTHSNTLKVFQPCSKYYTDSRFEKISRSKALPGDIVLLNKGGVNDHIGMYIGKNSDGVMTFVHCTGRYGKVPGVIENNEDRFLSSSAVFYRYKGFKD